MLNHENIKSYEYINRPQSVRQLMVEIETLEKLIKKGEAEGKSKNEINQLFMELVNKKDEYKELTGFIYEVPIDISKSERTALNNIFCNLEGFTWSNSFGWIGQPKTLTKRLVDPLDLSPSLYDNIKITRATNESDGKLLPNTYISQLLFNGVGIDGILPNNISAFDKCEFLNMNWNLISGLLPRTIITLVNLKSICLSGNLLSGYLDEESFDKLKNLTHLDLSFNKYYGKIPEIFDNLSSLEILNLAGNKFEGSLPKGLLKLNSLKELKLYSNQLSGIIPSAISNLKLLKHCNLSQNQFTDGFDSLCNCLKLEILQLNNNKLIGRINSSISNLTQLKILYLQHNKFSGLLPNELCSLQSLKRLNLSDNNFRGVLPNDIGCLSNLETFLLSDNSIIGPVPLSISNLQNLKDFHIFKRFPSQSLTLPKSFDKKAFERIYIYGPSTGINNINWSFPDLYGRERTSDDDDTVTVFSGAL